MCERCHVPHNNNKREAGNTKHVPPSGNKLFLRGGGGISSPKVEGKL